jgi:hypothetical protein
MARFADRAGEIAVTGAEQTADQLVEFGCFRFIAQLRRNRLGIVAQPVDGGFPLLADHPIEALFEFAPRQGAREPSAPCARVTQVFQIGARYRGEPHTAERSIAVDRLRAGPWTEGQAG